MCEQSAGNTEFQYSSKKLAHSLSTTFELTYRKIPNICTGLVKVHKHSVVGIYWGLIFRTTFGVKGGLCIPNISAKTSKLNKNNYKGVMSNYKDGWIRGRGLQIPCI